MSQGNIKITELQLSNDKLLPEVVRLLNEGHTVTLRLRGYSMRPFLEDGRDKALLTKPSVVKVGDPVLAEISKGRYVLHRVVAIDNNKVTLRGDGNLGIEKCTINDIKGAVIGFYRKGRDILDRTDGNKWKTYSYIWTRLLPIRRYLLFVHRHLVVNNQH